MRTTIHSSVLTIAAVLTIPACAGVISPRPTTSETNTRHIFYAAAQRAMRLPDGSDLLIYESSRPDDRPPAKRVFIVSPKGHEGDRSFTLETFIPKEIEPGFPGQIRSVAVSPDGKRLAAVGGWFSSRDKHGHNGLFILRFDEEHGGFWRLESWFDVPEMALGDVAFGPDNLLLATTQPHEPGTGAAPIVTLFSNNGHRVGSFVVSPRHGELSSSSLEMRISRTGERSYAIYDPEVGQVRYLSLLDRPKPQLVQTKSVKIPFSTERVNLVAFDPHPDGRIALGRTVIENHRGRTVITVIDDKGDVVEEWTAPRSWRYGFADEKHVLHGFSSQAGTSVMEIRAVDIR